MAESHTTVTQEIKKTVEDVMRNIINNIEYDIMEAELSVFDNYREEPTVSDLAGLLYYATQFAAGDSSETIQQDDDSSPTGPV